MFTIQVNGCHDCPYNRSTNDGSSDRSCRALDEIYGYPDGDEAGDIRIPPEVIETEEIWCDCPKYKG